MQTTASNNKYEQKQSEKTNEKPLKYLNTHLYSSLSS